MSAAPVPTNETHRKQVLDSLGLLDTSSESFSDAVAIAAAALASVPISAISLVDTDRQWFKSSCGLEVNETPRDISFCAHAILQTEPLVIADAITDPRFANNPLVEGPPFIRFYAGFPLVVRGEPIGALCVIDTRPRVLAADTIERLTALAAGASEWLGDRRALLRLLKHSEDDLHQVRFYDSVTGLPKRHVFDEQLEQQAKRCEIAGNCLAVLFIDIDGFEATKAIWGDTEAARALRQVGTRLLTVVRASDLVAHPGGDQFLILASGIPGPDAAIRIAEQIGQALRQPVGVAAHRTRFTASIGVSLYPLDGAVDQIVGNANTAMVQVRKAGGNSFGLFKPKMSAEARQEMELVEELRLAVERDELELHYQPKIEAISGKTTGAEALLRWNRPGRAAIGPAVFVPIAETAGLINELGSWVIAAACRQMGAWCKAGIHMRVSINISVHQLRLPHLGDEIGAQLAHHGVDPSLLTCEITESVAMDDAATSLATFERLRASGVQLSIDDFGTGYSSLSYLTKLPVSQLKIDRSFITELTTDDNAMAVVACIIHLSHALRLEVVAEGVETAEQRDMLVNMGCDAFQGYFFAMPMTADNFTQRASQARVA